MDTNSIYNDENQKKNVVDTIAKFCDRCGTPYSLDDFNIIKSTTAVTIIHFTCHKCKAQHIASISKKNGNMQRMPLLTDLIEDREISKFSHYDRIPLEEVLKLYNYLKKNKNRSL